MKRARQGPVPILNPKIATILLSFLIRIHPASSCFLLEFEKTWIKRIKRIEEMKRVRQGPEPILNPKIATILLSFFIRIHPSLSCFLLEFEKTWIKRIGRIEEMKRAPGYRDFCGACVRVLSFE